MSDESAEAWALLEAGDVRGTMRHLRFAADKLAVAELARIVGRASRLMDFADLAQASEALAAAPGRAEALYDFGYACVEHGAGYAAVPALSEALRLAPDSPMVLSELVVALEDVGRHGEAVRVLEERDATLSDWPHRYLLVYNAVMAGDLPTATRHAARLPSPEDERWAPAYDRITRMLGRAAAARTAGPLDHRDLRGWQFVLTGTLLSTLSPFGFDDGMTGRYAYTQDDVALCRYGLRRLQVILGATGRRPSTVSLLPDRSSHILGLAAAEILGLPAVPFAATRPDTVVVAYDLTTADEGVVGELRDRAPGQLLYEHATCWTDPPAVPADVSTFLRQTVVPPWGERLRRTANGEVETTPADDRPAERIAAEITNAPAEPDPGDGATPPDPDETLAAFATAVASEWPTDTRDRVSSAGPVPSSRFL